MKLAVARLWLCLVRPKFRQASARPIRLAIHSPKTQLIAGGVAGVALVVLAGSVAAPVLVLDQLA